VSSEPDMWRLFMTGCGILLNLMVLVGAGIAFARLKATAAGFLIGGGMVIQSLCGLSTKAYRALVLTPALESGSYGDGSIEGLFDQMRALAFASSCTATLSYVFIAIGILMIPRALAGALKAGPATF